MSPAVRYIIIHNNSSSMSFFSVQFFDKQGNFNNRSIVALMNKARRKQMKMMLRRKGKSATETSFVFG